uniref:F-box domain-containing protein n=1 Tax=Rhizophagus irregularis (strain DAOM 181602 / DAOM 197198 / MUCL 43194) TaxID=747089 RepID=U9UKK6_RHIID
MTCSKIFSGDLPELTNEIIQYFRKDFSTLYSCILVNRLWCRLAIPLLWEDPFSLPTQNYHCIKTYLCFLNEDDKAKFNEYGINDNLFLSNTLFNYPSFIKYLDTIKIYNSIQNWVIT